jgi:hypothetical protein
MHKRTKVIPQHQAKVKDEGILDRLREYVHEAGESNASTSEMRLFI